MLVTHEEDVENSEEEPEPEFGETPQLSMNSIMGFTSRRSLKVWGSINDNKVIVLIDCGATHNFISKKLVEKLQLEVEDTPSYVVEVGDGHKIKCKGVCRKVPVIRWEELTVFGMLVCVLRLCLQNVAVSKSRHRILFYPTRKGKKALKKFLF